MESCADWSGCGVAARDEAREKKPRFEATGGVDMTFHKGHGLWARKQRADGDATAVRAWQRL